MQSLTKKKKFRLFPYICVLPVIIAYSVWCYFPFIKSIVLSMTICNAKGQIKKWVWFQNFVRFFTDPDSVKILMNTLKLALMVGCGTLLIAMVFALMCIEKKKGCRVYQTMFALPMAVASVAAATAFKMLFKAEGLVNAITGMTFNWFLSEKLALPTVAVATVWCSIGSSFLFLLVGFRNVPVELLESAKMDGAGPIRRIFSVVLPCASPQIFFVIFLNINSSFKTYVMIRQLTAGGPNQSTMTLMYKISLLAMKDGRYETACAQSMILCVIIWIFQKIQFTLEDKLVVY